MRTVKLFTLIGMADRVVIDGYEADVTYIQPNGENTASVLRLSYDDMDWHLNNQDVQVEDGKGITVQCIPYDDMDWNPSNQDVQCISECGEEVEPVYSSLELFVSRPFLESDLSA